MKNLDKKLFPKKKEKRNRRNLIYFSFNHKKIT